MVVSQKDGFAVDYQHIDMVLGTSASADIFSPIVDWMQEHPAFREGESKHSRKHKIHLAAKAKVSRPAPPAPDRERRGRKVLSVDAPPPEADELEVQQQARLGRVMGDISAAAEDMGVAPKAKGRAKGRARGEPGPGQVLEPGDTGGRGGSWGKGMRTQRPEGHRPPPTSRMRGR